MGRERGRPRVGVVDRWVLLRPWCLARSISPALRALFPNLQSRARLSFEELEPESMSVLRRHHDTLAEQALTGP